VPKYCVSVCVLFYISVCFLNISVIKFEIHYQYGIIIGLCCLYV